MIVLTYFAEHKAHQKKNWNKNFPRTSEKPTSLQNLVNPCVKQSEAQISDAGNIKIELRPYIQGSSEATKE